MKSVLITGCNRGIGLGLVQQFLKLDKPPKYLIATCRNIEKAPALKKIADENPNVHVIVGDLNEFDKYDDIVKQVENIVKNDGLNVLINNAGVGIKFTRIGLLKPEQMTDTYLTNTVVPLMLTKACLPLLKKASENNSSLPLGISRAAVINMTSVLGSIQENNDGGWYPYRCSKAALNIATKSLSIDLRSDNILVMSLHPGWVKTDMGGKNAPLEVEEAVSAMVKTICKLSDKDNGGFIQYDGKVLPW